MGRPLWQAELSWAIPNGATLAKLRYWLEALDGHAGSVQLWNFAAPYPRAIGTTGMPTHWVPGNTVQIAAFAGIGGTGVQLKGLQASQPAVVQGQFVQVGRRLYVAAGDVTADGAGLATVIFTTPLIAEAFTNDIARLSQAACEMRLEKQDFDERSEAMAGFVRVSASFIETVVDYA